MACIPIPTVSLPTLGGGLTVAPPALPSVSLNAGLCCKTVSFTAPPIPIPLPPLSMNPAFFAAVNAALAAYQAWLDALPVACPLE